MKQTLLFVFLIFTTILLSQTKVSGEVKDEFGEPVAFANVIFKDSNEGTITNENGRFYLESEENHTALWVSFVGYELKTVPLEKKTTYELEILLKEEAAALDQVVVFSGKTSKKDNPAITILEKIWENRRENGVKKFNQYQ
nr:carboxypeptidase-like regulatory domain-containing protein [Bacteroidota bacterium]